MKITHPTLVSGDIIFSAWDTVTVWNVGQYDPRRPPKVVSYLKKNDLCFVIDCNKTQSVVKILTTDGHVGWVDRYSVIIVQD